MVAVLLAALPSVAQNLALNPGFESGTTSWFSTGPATLTSPNAQSHSGSRSGVLVNRTDAWNGIHQSVLGVLQPTNTYKISAWVRLVGGGSSGGQGHLAVDGGLPVGLPALSELSLHHR